MRKSLLCSLVVVCSLFGVGQQDAAEAQSSFDPCLATGVLKSSAPIAITTATTKAIIAAVAGQIIYVCGITWTTSEVVTTANTLKFEYGTKVSTDCDTGAIALTGAFGTGGITAGVPIVQSIGYGNGTAMSTPISNAFCAVTTIGASAAFEGVVSYVQM